MKDKNIILIDIDEFAKMSSDEICKYLRKNKDAFIIGDNPGLDRKIVKYNGNIIR
jgi:hypothetical protein